VKDALTIWDDAQLLKGIPKDRPVMIARRMWDITETMNGVLEVMDRDFPNVMGVTCVLNPHTHRIVELAFKDDGNETDTET